MHFLVLYRNHYQHNCFTSKMISFPSFSNIPIPFFPTMSTPVIKNATMRIAKRIARSGICSRREAEKKIGMGVVRINGVLISSPAVNVTPFDTVSVDGEDLPYKELGL